MTLPLFDGDVIDLKQQGDGYASGGLVAGLNGSLQTWSVYYGAKNHTAIFGSAKSTELDTVAHTAGKGVALRLAITDKPTYVLDFDQLSNGNVIVSWIEPRLRGPGTDSFYRIYDSAGHAVGDKTGLNPTIKTDFMTVRLTALDEGGFCGTWAAVKNGSNEAMYQLYTADGTATGSAIRMNPVVTGGQTPFEITDLAGDGFWACGGIGKRAAPTP